ncbi:hypothetical protein [Nocardia fusca]|uniref:Uncharacterized protein n=1 Tax=Nocardia fusca TaxID=941183 RepID=A0ABV3F8E3_9NOCA
MMRQLSTTGGEVVQFFTRGGKISKGELTWWRNRRGCGHVANAVLAHTTRTPYTIASEDILRLPTSHSLGEINRNEAQKVRSIRDWYPDFAFTHLFHFMLEDAEKAFSWEEFQEWSRSEEVRAWLWDPAQEAIGQARSEGFTQEQAENAMQWRQGLAYYSFLRELYVIAAIRERDIPLLVHPLADALFRVDAWCGNILLELYVENAQFKARKLRAQAQDRRLLQGSATVSCRAVRDRTPAHLWQCSRTGPGAARSVLSPIEMRDRPLTRLDGSSDDRGAKRH